LGNIGNARGVQKNDRGGYYLWVTSSEAVAGSKCLHYVCYFHDEAQLRSLPAALTIRGLCKGKRGTVDTNMAVDKRLWRPLPSLLFEDCQLVEQPSDNPGRPMGKAGLAQRQVVEQFPDHPRNPMAKAGLAQRRAAQRESSGPPQNLVDVIQR